MKYIGYKIVAKSKDSSYALSLYDRERKISLSIGSIEEDKKGLYLGENKNFVKDYYTGLTDNPDMLLTYEYDEKDVISGNPRVKNSEVKVLRMELIQVEEIGGE